MWISKSWSWHQIKGWCEVSMPTVMPYLGTQYISVQRMFGHGQELLEDECRHGQLVTAHNMASPNRIMARVWAGTATRLAFPHIPLLSHRPVDVRGTAPVNTVWIWTSRWRDNYGLNSLNKHASIDIKTGTKRDRVVTSMFQWLLPACYFVRNFV